MNSKFKAGVAGLNHGSSLGEVQGGLSPTNTHGQGCRRQRSTARCAPAHHLPNKQLPVGATSTAGWRHCHAPHQDCPSHPPTFQVLIFFLSVTPSERHWGRARNTSNTRPPTSLAHPWEKMAVGHGLLVPHAARAPRTAGKVQGKCCARPCPTLQACPSQAEHGTAAPFPFSPRYPSSWDVIFSPLKR